MSNTKAPTQATQPAKATPAPSSLLQRTCACGNHTPGGGECAECKRQKLQRKPLTINTPGDQYEQEADRVADMVTRSESARGVSFAALPTVSRFAGGDGAAGGTAPAIVQDVLNSPGQSLDAGTRAMLEPRFGHDFGSVRVHTDGRAAESARAVNARAYTVGNNVVFGANEYVLSTNESKWLLAHELVHVRQQNTEQSIYLQTQSNRKGKKGKPARKITKVTLFVDRDIVVLEIDNKVTLTLPTVYNGRPKPGSYKIIGSVDIGVTGGVLSEKKFLVAWNNPSDATYSTAYPFVFHVIPGQPGPSNIASNNQSESTGNLAGDDSSKNDNTNGEGSKNKRDDKDKVGADQSGNSDDSKNGNTEYGTPLAADPDQDRPSELKTIEDYDKEFKYDLGWQTLSPADRKLLMDYSRMSQDEIRNSKIDFIRITDSMKIMMALKLSDTSLLGEMAGAAKNAFTDPKFLVTLIIIAAVYVGLWLTPDPSLITKILAGALTIALLIQFAYEDIYGFLVAWSDLSDKSGKAKSGAELKAIGDQFLRRIGTIGFDIMLFLVMGRIGKRVSPKLKKIGAERGVRRADAKVKALESKPGSGVYQPSEIKTGDLLSQAKTISEGATETQLLNALAKLLPENAREGLAKFRGNTNDTNIVKALEDPSARGSDLVKFLTEKSMSLEAKQAVKNNLNQAQVDLARAKLILAETINDPFLRQTVREEQYRSIQAILEQTGSLQTADIKQALAARDVQMLMRSLRNIISKLGEKVSAHETQGALGESIQRAQLRIKYVGRKSVRILSNLALVRKVGQYKSLREWITAEEGRVRQQQSDISQESLNKAVGKTRVKLFEKDGQVFESVGEIDTMVAEPNATGLLHPIEIAETKAGGAKQPSEAAQQLTNANNLLAEIAKSTSDVQIFEMIGKKQLGKNLTATFDLSQSNSIERTTFGPEGKGFKISLGFKEAELKGLAESLLKNLPPDKPPKIPPIASPREHDTSP